MPLSKVRINNFRRNYFLVLHCSRNLNNEIEHIANTFACFLQSQASFLYRFQVPWRFLVVFTTEEKMFKKAGWCDVVDQLRYTTGQAIPTQTCNIHPLVWSPISGEHAFSAKAILPRFLFETIPIQSSRRSALKITLLFLSRAITIRHAKSLTDPKKICFPSRTRFERRCPSDQILWTKTQSLGNTLRPIVQRGNYINQIFLYSTPMSKCITWIYTPP